MSDSKNIRNCQVSDLFEGGKQHLSNILNQELINDDLVVSLLEKSGCVINNIRETIIKNILSADLANVLIAPEELPDALLFYSRNFTTINNYHLAITNPTTPSLSLKSTNYPYGVLISDVHDEDYKMSEFKSSGGYNKSWMYIKTADEVLGITFPKQEE